MMSQRSLALLEDRMAPGAGRPDVRARKQAGSGPLALLTQQVTPAGSPLPFTVN